jgi:putative salt-induced outer membrane protein YdiY
MKSRQQPNRSWIAGGCCLFLLWLVGARVWGAESTTLVLRNGDRITGVIKSEDTNKVILVTPWVKELVVPTSLIKQRQAVQVASTPTPPTTAGAGATPGPVMPPPNVKPSHLLAGEFNVGTDLGFGQKDHQLYSARAKLIYSYERYKNTLDYNFSYGKTAGVLAANQMSGFWKIDYELGHRYYLYGISGVGYDEIRQIDFGYELGPGVGYHLIQQPAFVLNTEAGVDYQVQNLSNDTSTELFFLRLAENFTWRLNSKITLDEKFEFFPHLQEIDIYRFRFETNFRYQLMTHLAFNLTVTDAYESQPADTVTKNDLQVRSSVGVKF